MRRWGHWDLNPDQRVSSAHRARQRDRAHPGRDGSALQLFIRTTSANPLVVIPVQLEPAVLPGYTIPPRGGRSICRPLIRVAVGPNARMVTLILQRAWCRIQLKDHWRACRRARLRRRSFFLRHFHLCLPAFFQAREPRFTTLADPGRIFERCDMTRA